jgi:glycosyltransferase involved in cell wall biosynthesis
VFKVAWNLVQNLRKLRDVEVEVIYDNKTKNFLDWLIFDHYTLPKTIFLNKSDLYHAILPDEAIPLVFLNKKPIVTHFHDIIPIVFPFERKLIPRLYFRYATFLAKRSEAIIAVSQSTKNDIVKRLKIEPDKIHVVYNGVNHDLFKPRKSEPEENLIGYVGGLGKRKNVFSLIIAFHKVIRKGVNGKLLIGGVGSEEQNLRKLVEKLGIKRRVEFLGFIPEEKLPVFYSMLKVFVFPSLYEGFGIPVLEAMACGTPVITSNTSSLPEIVGKGGILVNPYNVNELAEAIYGILTNDELRKNLIKKGLRRAKQFSWEKTAKETLKVYYEVL